MTSPQVIVFDFDGTLVDSNAIKRTSYYEVLADIPGHREKIDAILDRPDSGDRHDVFKAFCRAADLPDSACADLVARYSDVTERAITECPAMPGALETVARFAETALKMFVSSGTPRDALDAILRRRGMRDLFIDVYGMPWPKERSLEHIRDRTGASWDEILVVGDGLADSDSANAFGCPFVPVFAYPADRAIDPILTDLRALAPIAGVAA